MSRYFLLALGLLSASILAAQKLRLDSALLKGELVWPSAEGAMISADGKYAAYQINGKPKKGSRTLVVASTEIGWRKEFPETEYLCAITGDSHWYIFQKGDSLVMQSLGSDEQRYIPRVSSWQLLGTGNQQWLVYQVKDQDKLVMRSLPGGHEHEVVGVTQFTFNKQNTAIVLTKENKINDSTVSQELSWMDWPDGQRKIIWQGNTATNMIFDESGEEIAFRGEIKKGGQLENSIYYYKKGMNEATALVSSQNIDNSFSIAENDLLFSRDGGRLFFKLTQKKVQKPFKQGVQMDVWHYQDLHLQSEQLQQNFSRPHSYAAVAKISTRKILQLQQGDEDIQFSHTGADDQALVIQSKGFRPDGYWNPRLLSNIYRISTLDGSRQLIQEKVNNEDFSLFSFSPDGKWMLRFNQAKKCWYSYDRAGKSYNISSSIPYAVGYDSLLALQYPRLHHADPFETGGWSPDSRFVYLYDYYDVWKVNIAGNERPVCITKGYGRKNYLKLRIAWDEDHHPAGQDYSDPFGGVKRIIGLADTLLLSAFTPVSKDNGFCKLIPGGIPTLKKLFIGSVIEYATESQVDRFSFASSTFLLKAQQASTWVVRKESATAAPNYFITKDFKTYKMLSDVHPEQKYNWLTAKLVNYKLPDGTNNQGILYKPENFNPLKKYPVIINYYERLADGLNRFKKGTELVCGDIADNVAYFTSHGYLVFQPDIRYRVGYVGQSVFDAVVSGVKYLQQLPYVDIKHMAINGHSFGGWETNYLITHTELFAAAAEAAGPTDFISLYGTEFGGGTNQYRLETDQLRLSVSLWERPDIYIENSPILDANKVTTPFLMMHSNSDGNLRFSQSVEFFTVLRRLGKRVWLLQYDKQGHTLVSENSKLDYTIRLTQFLDHYLKGAPCPKWMLDGIPARLKGIETGYELDNTGREPQEQPVLYNGKIQLVREALRKQKTKK